MWTRGGRLELRAFEEADADAVVAYLHHPDLWGRRRIEGDLDGPMSGTLLRKAIESWNAPEHGAAYVIEHVDGVVGHVRVGWWWDVLCPWVEVVVAPDHQRQGIGSEAGELILDHLFLDTPAHVVHAEADDWNEAGLRFAEHLGFGRAGAMRRTGIRRGRYVDSVHFELLRTDWEGARDGAHR